MKHEIAFYGGSIDYVDADIFISESNPYNPEFEWHFRIFKDIKSGDIGASEPQHAIREDSSFNDGLNPPSDVWCYLVSIMPEILNAIDQEIKDRK